MSKNISELDCLFSEKRILTSKIADNVAKIIILERLVKKQQKDLEVIKNKIDQELNKK